LAYPLIFLPFISSAFVPTATMPGPVRAFAEHQPVTSIVNASRDLLECRMRRQSSAGNRRCAVSGPNSSVATPPQMSSGSSTSRQLGRLPVGQRDRGVAGLGITDVEDGPKSAFTASWS
jgi:hypothetical protein